MRKIFLLDGYNLLYRSFYAVPPFTDPEGRPINAVFGLAKMLSSFANYENPDYLAVVMDSREPTFREKIYAEYKATRDRMPDDLRVQEPLLYELFESLSVPTLAMGGFEADDIIGTLATKLSKDADNDVYIVSGDKDLYQFVGENVAVYDTMKRITARRKEAIEKFAVPPERVVDYLAIVGDSSDNIPGIPGFGPKKAETLIGTYGSLEDIYANIESITGKTKETLEANREVAFLSKKLATIDTEVPVVFELESAKFNPADFRTEKAKEFFRKFGFKSLLPKEETILADFSSLKFERSDLVSRAELDALLVDILKTESISFAAYSNSGRRLSGVVIGLGDTYYVARAKALPIADFLRVLLASKVEMKGFDMKESLRLCYRYLDESEGELTVEEAQASLF